MAKISQKRMRELEADREIVHRIYLEDCQRFGREAIEKSLHLIWIYRCMAKGAGGISPRDGLPELG